MKTEPVLFNRLITRTTQTNGIKNMKNIGLDQKDSIIELISRNNNISNPEFAKAIDDMFIEMANGNFAEGISKIKKFMPNQAALKETKLGLA